MRGRFKAELFHDGILVSTHEESNIIVDGFGELLADVMTANPSFAEIESASSILDASNYTIQALTLGKDPESYNLHGHDPQVSGFQLVREGVHALTLTSQKSYQPSANTNIGLPSTPSPYDTRLERQSTQVSSVTGVDWDVGHNLNYLIVSGDDTKYSGGCYPPSGGVDVYVLSSIDASNTTAASGNFSGTWNLSGHLDSSGHLRIDVSSAQEGNIVLDTLLNEFRFLMRTSSFKDSSSVPLEVTYQTVMSAGDYVLSNLYGGIYSFGLYGIDIKRTLSNGASPPFQFSQINNPIRYRLLAKKVFNTNLVDMNDVGAISAFAAFDGSLGPKLTLALGWTIEF